MKISWVCFAKPTIKGFVKTRLARNLGDDNALQIYSWLLALQCKNLFAISKSAATKTNINRFNVYTSIPADFPFSKAKKLFKKFFTQINSTGKEENKFFDKVKIKLQQGSNLGQKMEHCINSELKKNDLVVLWGSDIPFITEKHLLSAMEKYPHCSLSPVVDGGYCLISVSKQLYQEGFMDNIPWSSHNTLIQQQAKMNALGMKYQENETLYDIDTDRDLIFAINKMSKSTDLSLTENLKQLYDWLDLEREKMY